MPGGGRSATLVAMQRNVTFSQALARRMPVETFIVLGRDRAGTDNPITVNWVMRTSIKPALMAVSIAHARYSHGVIREAGEFVVAAPSVDMEEETRLFGSVSGRDHVKLAEAGSATEAASAVDCVLLSDAVLNIECRLQDVFDTGDHSIFVGEVLASHTNADESVKRLYTVGAGHVFGPVHSGSSG